MFLESPWNIGTYLRGNIFFIVKNQFYLWFKFSYKYKWLNVHKKNFFIF